ncbi:SPW repeat protein [soil metagenome]
MRVIPTLIHGFLDYGVALLLIVSPWILGFADGGAEQWVPVALGIFVIVYSLVTDYELSVARMLSMPAHLGLDIAGGAVLALSPWLFGFADEVWAPHLIFGILEIGASLLTQQVQGVTARSSSVVE